jgi:tyrosyl-tRNA synthetase
MAYETLRARGFVQQVSDEAGVKRLLQEGNATVYIGYDPTADSLHVGHLFTLMALYHLAQAGHRAIVLLGGGTAHVGDPSGKTEMRQLLESDAIESNKRAIAAQVRQLLGDRVVVADNADWLLDLAYIPFLRDIGRHFSVNRMLSAEAYKQRMERGLSFIEFNYQLLQAYDFLELCRRYDCRLQMGGDDQWGNILAGVDLCRRVAAREVFALTLPLILTASGDKMGKTAQGAVWLDPDKLSPYDYYQYWVNAHDDDVQRLLGFYTLLPVAEIAAVSVEGAAINQVKSVLAFEATAFVHGRQRAEEAHQAALAAFGGRSIDPALLPSSVVPRAAAASVDALPETVLTGEHWPVVDLMVQAALAKSKSEARRLIAQGAVRIEDGRVEDAAHEDGRVEDAAHEVGRAAAPFLLRVGKKKLHRFRVA